MVALTDGPQGATPQEQMALQKARSRLLAARPSSVSISRYELKEKFGRGASATVWRARDPKLDRDVALKLVERWDTWAGSETEARARVLREAQAVAALSHPNIAPIYDVGKFDAGQGRQGVFLAMEFLDGQSLRTWMQSEPDRDEVLDVFDQAARGLQAAHAAGIVHRDFKPSNAMLDPQGRVRVIDFGLARSIGATPSADAQSGLPMVTSDTTSLTATGTVMGTPAYMSPEQHAGGVITEASDQYSLCVALFEALAGERPFAGNDLTALATAKLGCEIPKETLRRLPKEQRAVLMRGLSPDPAQRWPNLEMFREALRPRKTQRPWGWIAAGSGVVVAAVSLVWGTGNPEPPNTPQPSPAEHRAGAPSQAIAHARLLRETGESGRAEEQLEQLLAETTDSPQLRAATVAELSRALLDRGAVTEALQRSEAAFFEASQAQAYVEAFDLAALLADQMFSRDPVAARRWLGQTEAMFERGDLSAVEEARLLGLRARVSENEFDLERAAKQLDRAHSLLQEHDDPATTLTILASRGRLAVRLGDFERYIEMLEEAATYAQLEFGPRHARTAQALGSLAETYAYAGRFEDAQQTLQAAWGVAGRAFDPGHVAMGTAWASRALVYGEAMEHGVALDAFDAAAAIYSQLGSDRDRDLLLAGLWLSRGLTLAATGRPEDALQTMLSARDLQTRVLGANHVFEALYGNNITMVLRDMGRLEDAEREALAVAALYEALPSVDPTVRSFTYIALTKLMLDTNRNDEARAWADATIEVWADVPNPTEDAAVARFYAAKATLETDRGAAEAYARDALARAESSEGAAMLKGWLVTNGFEDGDKPSR